MIAVINIDGRQLKVEKNQELYISKISGEKGDKMKLNTVSLIEDGKSILVGTPLVDGAEVGISIVEQKKDKKCRPPQRNMQTSSRSQWATNRSAILLVLGRRTRNGFKRRASNL